MKRFLLTCQIVLFLVLGHRAEAQSHYYDACEANPWTYYAINVSTNTQVSAGVMGKKFYLCKLFVAPAAAPVNFNLVESSTSGNACATNPVGMLGGSTAALGAQVAVNGGYVLPYDLRAWAVTATAGDAVCILTSAQVTGVMAFVVF